MVEGMLLVCDECIDISQNVKLVRFDDNWQSYNNGKISVELWSHATIICKDLGILVDKRLKKCRLIWENGEYKDIKYKNNSDLLEEVSQFIIGYVGLRGLRERAFEKDSTEIINESTMIDEGYTELKNYSSGWDIKIYKIQIEGGELIQFKIGVKLYYGILNRENKDWLIDIGKDYSKVSVNKSGEIVFERGEIVSERGMSLGSKYVLIKETVYKQEKIASEFLTN